MSGDLLGETFLELLRVLIQPNECFSASTVGSAIAPAVGTAARLFT
jgi:hypothetical protein